MRLPYFFCFVFLFFVCYSLFFLFPLLFVLEEAGDAIGNAIGDVFKLLIAGYILPIDEDEIFVQPVLLQGEDLIVIVIGMEQ